MGDEPLTDAERRIRAALRPGDERARRIVHRALAAQRRRAPFPWHLRVLAAVTIAVAVVVALLWPSGPPSAAALTISGTGSLIVVTSDDGRRWLLDFRDDAQSRGEYVIAIPQ